MVGDGKLHANQSDDGPTSPSAWRYGSRNTARKVKAVVIARSE